MKRALLLFLVLFFAPLYSANAGTVFPPSGAVDAEGKVQSCPPGQALTWSVKDDGGHTECTPNLLPSGAIMYFYLESCPPGWILADGQNNTPDLRGEFIRGLDAERGVDENRSLGSPQAATSVMTDWRDSTGGWEFAMSDFGNHSTDADEINEIIANQDPVTTLYTGQLNRSDDWNIEPNSWATEHHKVKVTLYRVRPRNVALLVCMRQ